MMCNRRSRRRVLRPTAFRPPSRRSIITRAGSPSKAASPNRSTPIAAAGCSKPVPTRAAPPMRSGGKAAPSGLSLVRFGDRLGHVEKLAPDLCVGDRVIQPDELDRLGALQLLAPLAVLRTELGIIR